MNKILISASYKDVFPSWIPLDGPSSEMDQAVRDGLLNALQEDKDLDEEDCRILVNSVERYEPEVRELMREAMDEDAMDEYTINTLWLDEAIQSVMEVLVESGRLDGKSEFLWNPEHKRWKDITQCDSMLQEALTTWMELEWG